MRGGEARCITNTESQSRITYGSSLAHVHQHVSSLSTKSINLFTTLILVYNKAK